MKIGKQDASDFMRRVGWLSGLPGDAQKVLLDIARLVEFEPGEPLYRQEDPPGAMYGMISGCVAFETTFSDIYPHILYFVYPGAWFGHITIIGRPTRVSGAHATRQSMLFEIEGVELKKAARTMPDLWRHLALLSVDGEERQIGLVEDLMRRGSRERLAAILVRLAGLHEKHPPKPAIIDATQTEIATIANLSRSVVSSLLPEMQRDGLVKLGRACIEIVDRKGLENFA